MMSRLNFLESIWFAHLGAQCLVVGMHSIQRQIQQARCCGEHPFPCYSAGGCSTEVSVPCSTGYALMREHLAHAPLPVIPQYHQQSVWLVSTSWSQKHLEGTLSQLKASASVSRTVSHMTKTSWFCLTRKLRRSTIAGTTFECRFRAALLSRRPIWYASATWAAEFHTWPGMHGAKSQNTVKLVAGSHNKYYPLTT